MKKIIFSSVLVTLLAFVSSCDISKEQTKEEVKAEFLTELKGDSDFIKLCDWSRDYSEKASIDYYNFTSHDRSYIEKNRQSIDKGTIEEKISIYEKAGIKNAREYLNSREEGIRLRKLILERYKIPVEKIGIKEAAKAMAELITQNAKPKFDYDKILQRANNNGN